MIDFILRSNEQYLSFSSFNLTDSNDGRDSYGTMKIARVKAFSKIIKYLFLSKKFMSV